MKIIQYCKLYLPKCSFGSPKSGCISIMNKAAFSSGDGVVLFVTDSVIVLFVTSVVLVIEVLLILILFLVVPFFLYLKLYVIHLLISSIQIRLNNLIYTE